jgi:hypothetical protein
MNYNEYQRNYQIKRYHARRAESLEMLGGKCVECGSTDELEIDHIDPATKKLEVSRLWGVSRERWLAEIAKCQILCKPHHIHKYISNEEWPEPKRGEEHCQAKLTDDLVRYIRTKPMSQRKLAAELNVSRGLIQQVQDGKVWKHVV